MILKFALREFLDDCKYTNLSDHTIKNYKRILNSFVEYCVGQENITSVKDVSRGTIRGFLSYCRGELGNSASTEKPKLMIL